MKQTFYSSLGWEEWGVERKPVIPEGMPVLIDDDLLFEDGLEPRPTLAVNRWLRELPSSGCPSPSSWKYYAQIVRAWLEFLAVHGVAPFGERARLKAALGAYAVHRAAGPPGDRFEATTWNQHVAVLGGFYRWAVAEGYAEAVPFTYKQAQVAYGDEVRELEVNLARRRVPKAHVTIKYLEPDFLKLFLNALAGLGPDGTEDAGYRGRELMRNASVAGLAVSAGLRYQEFTYLLALEVPALPVRRSDVPIPFPVAAGLTKGAKFRTTWVDYTALAEVHQYLELVRPLSTAGSGWMPPAKWGPALEVTKADAFGGRIGGRRVRWAQLRPAERRRLVGPDGGSMLLAVTSRGGPFTAWPTVFARASARVRTYEPRFPTVEPHRLRHTMAMESMQKLVSGFYERAARQAADPGDDGAWLVYLKSGEPLLILRDLLGHSSVLTTEKYLNRLDMTRVFKESFLRAGQAHGLLEAVEAELAAEFEDEEALV